MGTIDLHLHTTASDGTETPENTVRLASKLGLRAIAVTDHDTCAGVRDAQSAGREYGVEVLAGVEFSTDYLGRHAHLLGYLIDPDCPALEPALNWAVTERDERNEKIVGLLRRDGFEISIEELKRENPDAVLGRPHIARWLLGKGYVRSVQEAFDTMLAEGMPYYLPKGRIPMQRAVSLILQAGGVPVLAHPLQYGYGEEELQNFLNAAVTWGVRGFEAVYSEHSPEQESFLRAEAARRGLLITGGSDWHGSGKPAIRMGEGMRGLNAEYSMVEALRAARQSAE